MEATRQDVQGITPGVWVTREATTVGEELDRMCRTEDMTVTPVYWAEADDTHDAVALVTTEADAQLVAAAPEMAEALRTVLDHLNTTDATHDRTGRPVDCSMLRRYVRALLDRIDGRA